MAPLSARASGGRTGGSGYELFLVGASALSLVALAAGRHTRRGRAGVRRAAGGDYEPAAELAAAAGLRVAGDNATEGEYRPYVPFAL